MNFRIEGLGDWFCDRTSCFARGDDYPLCHEPL